MPPAPETRAPPKNERVAQFSEAASNAYNVLVLGHQQRFKRHPNAAGNVSGKVVVRFTLDRGGRLIDSLVAKSSGNPVLDQAALEMLRRATPFPQFPAAKAVAQDAFVVPLGLYPSN